MIDAGKLTVVRILFLAQSKLLRLLSGLVVVSQTVTNGPKANDTKASRPIRGCTKMRG